MTTLSAHLRDTVAQIASYESNEINPEHLMIDDLGFDSLMLMDLFASLAKRHPEIRKIDASATFSKDITFHDLESELRSLLSEEIDLTPSAPLSVADMTDVVAFEAFLSDLGNDLPFFTPHQGIASNHIRYDDQDYVNYSSYNYLGTNGHPRVRDAVTRAIDAFGTSVSASRMIGGEIDLHRELEATIAEFIGVDDSLVQVGGHSTNVNILGNLLTDQDLILHDSLAHNSLIQGALMSEAKRKPFRHSDMESLEKELARLRTKFRYVVIVVEGVYSMDGDICPLPELVAIKEKYDAFLMIDEAHSIGTIGHAGRGVASHFGIDPRRIDIHMGTLSKAFNSCGGYIAGSQRFIDFLRYNLPGFVFSVGLTPSNTAAALESIRLCAENPQWTEELRAVSTRFLGELVALGLNTGLSGGTPVVPLITGNSLETLGLSQRLFEHGINVSPILHPAVNEDEARLRFFLSRLHTEADLTLTFDALRDLAPMGLK